MSASQLGSLRALESLAVEGFRALEGTGHSRRHTDPPHPQGGFHRLGEERVWLPPGKGLVLFPDLLTGHDTELPTGLSGGRGCRKGPFSLLGEFPSFLHVGPPVALNSPPPT